MRRMSDKKAENLRDITIHIQMQCQTDYCKQLVSAHMEIKRNHDLLNWAPFSWLR